MKKENILLSIGLWACSVTLLASCAKTPPAVIVVTKQELYDGVTIAITEGKDSLGIFTPTANGFSQRLYTNGLNEYTDQNGVKLAVTPTLNLVVGKKYQMTFNFAENNTIVNGEYYSAWNIHQLFLVPCIVNKTGTQQTDDGTDVLGITDITPVNGVLSYIYTDTLPSGVSSYNLSSTQQQNPRLGLKGVFTVTAANAGFDLAVTLRHGLGKFSGISETGASVPEQANAVWNDPKAFTYANNDYSTVIKVVTTTQ